MLYDNFEPSYESGLTSLYTLLPTLNRVPVSSRNSNSYDKFISPSLNLLLTSSVVLLSPLFVANTKFKGAAISFAANRNDVPSARAVPWLVTVHRIVFAAIGMRLPSTTLYNTIRCPESFGSNSDEPSFIV